MGVKGGRMTKIGSIGCYHHHDRNMVAIVEIFCQTDFAAKNSVFCDLAKNLAMQLAAIGPSDEDSFLDSQFVKDPGFTIKELMASSSKELGEKLALGRYAVMKVGSHGAMFT
jgi:elongation factor Ts